MLKELKARVRRWLTPIDQPISDDSKDRPVTISPKAQDVQHNARTVTANELTIAVKHLATICKDGPLLHRDSLGVKLNQDGETYTITPQQLEEEIQRTISLAKTNANQLRADRAKEAEYKLNAMNDPYASRLFRHVKQGYTPPTSTLWDPHNKRRTSNVNQMMQLINNAWSPIYNRHKDQPPEWEAFREGYGQFFSFWR